MQDRKTTIETNNSNDQAEQLHAKYAAVFQAIEQHGISLTNVRLQDGKLFIQGAAPSVEAKNRVWDQIKAVDPAWEHDLVCDLRTEEEQPVRPHTGQTSVNTTAGFTAQNHADNRVYEVQEGDTLSKISQQFYGDASQYQRIFEANRDKLTSPDRISAGQVLTIPF